MYLSLNIARVDQSHYHVLVLDGAQAIADFETSSIGDAFRKASHFQVPGVDGFHVWFAGVFAGSASLAQIASDPEGFATLIIDYPRANGD